MKKNEVEEIVEALVEQLIDDLLCEIDPSNEQLVEHAFQYLEKIVQDIDFTDYIE